MASPIALVWFSKSSRLLQAAASFTHSCRGPIFGWRSKKHAMHINGEVVPTATKAAHAHTFQDTETTRLGDLEKYISQVPQRSKRIDDMNLTATTDMCTKKKKVN